MDYFDKASPINWYDSSTSEDFQAAIQYNVLSADPPHLTLWRTPKLRKLKKAIADVVDFLDADEGRKLVKNADDGVPMDPTDLEFWEHHLS